MPTILSDAKLSQRDASRRLYFVSAGCLFHPAAEKVLEGDPEGRAALEQSIEAALFFADLSTEEVVAFRERAVAETSVVRMRDGRYAFEQPQREPRRVRRRRDILRFFASSSPDAVAPPERRSEMRRRAVVARLLGILAVIWCLAWGSRAVGDAAAEADGALMAQIGLVLLGIVVAISVLWRLLRS